MQRTEKQIPEIIKRISPILLIFAVILAVIASDTPEKQQARAEVEQQEELAAALSGEYPMTISAFSLDTFCTLTIYAGGGSEALTNGVAALRRYDELFNQSTETSDIYRINHRTAGRVAISPETAELLELAKNISDASGGDFDVTVGKLTELWDFQHRTTAPSEAEVAAALAACDPDGFSVEYASGQSAEAAQPEAYFVTEDESLQIDIGAIAKGYIADKLREGMISDGVTSAVINLGGNVLCIGEQPEGEPFVIGLKKPEKNAQQDIARLAANDLSVVTAGIYERYFEENGVHYHHILSTKDGYPVQNGLAAVTVVGPRSAVCDALSTTLFIKGEEAGLAFLGNYNASLRGQEESGSYYAYFIGQSGGEIAASPGAEQLELH